MRLARASGLSAAALAIAFGVTSCDREAAELVAELASPAVASPQYFHGNCFAGWSVAFELRLRETNGVEVVLDELRYRVADASTLEELAGERLDRASLESRYGATATVVPGRSSRIFGLGFVVPDRPLGPLGVSGGFSGRDENGRAVNGAFDLTASVSVRGDEPPPSGGACP